jgi:hypothetical protein
VFDVTHPEKGWTELNSCLGSYIPYVDGYHQLFVRLNFHHGEGDGEGEGFLMFSCNLEQPQTVQVFHMSHECDSLKPMEPLQLPQFPPKFHKQLLRCKFFHLGGQKVGLVFCRDRSHDYNDYFNDYLTRDPDDDDDDDDEEEEEEEEEDYEDDDHDDYNDDGHGNNND